MSRHPQRAGLSRGRAHWRVGTALLLVVTLAVTIVLIGDARTCPRGGTLKAFAIVATPPNGADSETDLETRVRAGELPDLVNAVARQLEEGSLPAAPSRTDNVHAGQFLQVHARVTGSGGVPAVGVKVIFAWRQGQTISYDTAVSDGSGHAKAIHWIETAQRGHRTVLVVTASRASEYASAYTWFIPE